MKTKKLQLKNGLKVILVESHKSPVVSVQMWVRTGSADERKGEEGLSHFIEHLLFKGTKKFKVGEIAKIVEGSGGELNAYTSFDQTVFYVTISKNYADVGLNVISEMMGFPEFDHDELDKERGVVLEEIKRGLDSPSRQSYQMLFSTMYQGHPYSIPVIGYDKIIENTKAEKIKSFFKDRYNPTTMTLLVIGDFDFNEMKKEVEQKFSILPKNKFRKVTRKKLSKQSKPRVLVQEKPFEQTHTHIAWPTPKFNHKDIPALELMAMILGAGDSSRLVKALRLDKPLAQSVGAGCFTPNDEGFFSVSFLTNEADFDGCLKEISNVFKEFIENGVTEDELNRAKIAFESDDLYSLETVDGLSRKIGTYEFMFGDFNAYKKQMKLIREVKAQDIIRVFRKYLDPKKLNAVVMAKSHGKEIEKSLKSWIKGPLQSSLKAKPKKAKAMRGGKKLNLNWTMKASGTLPRTTKVVHSNGAKILLRPISDSPVVSLRVAGLGGLRFQKANEDGLTEIVSRLWTTGTKTRDEQKISEEIDSVAGSIEAFGGRNSLGLSLSVLAPFSKKASDLFFDVLKNPTFNEDKLVREKTILKHLIKQRDDNPASVASQLFLKGIFGDHPYSYDMLGKAENVDNVNIDKVRSFWKSLLKNPNLTVAISGDIDVKEWEKKINDELSSMDSSQVTSPKLSLKYPNQEIKSFQKLNKEQTHIIHGYPGVTLTSSDRFTLQVIQSILAGQGGRLFIELRDKESLAYSVSPLKMEGIEGGYFGAYIGCSPEKGKKAIDMMKVEFSKLMNDAVSDSEITSAKNYLIGRHDIELQKTSSVVSSILFDELYGNDFDETFKFAEKLKQVSASEVKSLAKKIFSQPAVTVAVGPSEPW